MNALAPHLPRRVRALLDSIPSIRELGVRRRTMRRHVLEWTPEQLVVVLERLVPLAARRHRRARETALATGLALIDVRYGDSAEVLAAAHALATQHGLQWARDLLSEPDGHKALPRLGRLPEINISSRKPFFLEPGTCAVPRTVYWEEPPPPQPWAAHYTDEEILGMPADELAQWVDESPTRHAITYGAADMRALQARAGFQLEACVLHPDPVFLRRFLRQTWVKERDVLRVASRRPSSREVVRTLVQTDRWIVLQSVQSAVLTNPFTPSAIALALLPSASARTIERVADAENVDPFVSAFAGQLRARMRRAEPAPS